MKSHNKINLIFIVNGVEVTVEANVHEPLKVARNQALKDSDNTGRPLDEWEVRNTEGTPLDPNMKIEELTLVEGTRLLLNLKVGAGGVK